jgi:hypothetical protein
VSESFLSPASRRRILKYKESISQRFSGFASGIPSAMSAGQHSAWKGKLPSMRNHWEGKFKTQTQKLVEKRRNYRLTKIRHSLDFIRKSKDSQKFKKLTFLGQLYGDVDVDNVEYDYNII